MYSMQITRSLLSCYHMFARFQNSYPGPTFRKLFKNRAPGLEIIQLMCKMKKRRNQALKMYSALTGMMINGKWYHKSKAKHWNATQYKNMTSSAEHLHLGKLQM